MTIQIPDKKKQFIQTNLSDVSGNVWYTKNINFDEQGYAKLSSRSVSIMSNEEDSTFGFVVAIGRTNLVGGAYISTGGNSTKQFTMTLSTASVSVTPDATGAAVPTGSLQNRGVWWQNRWHVTSDVSMFYKDTGGTWTVTGITLTTLFPHPLEVFKSRGTLAVGNGNVVQQYTSAYALTTSGTTPVGAQLTLPTDYTVYALAYSNDRMGIATQISNTLAGQNQEAIFAVWDGLQTSANNIYSVGSDAILAIRPYKSSWVLLTRNGRLLYFNGGGFETLATLPFFFKRYTIDAQSVWADVMTVQADLIYLNIPADINYFGLKQERYMENFVGGILCYDPKVGLYHRYSPSISKLTRLQVSSVDASTNILTITVGTIPPTGNPIMYTDVTTSIGGLTLGTVYYIINLSATTFALATTKALALAGTKIDLTSASASTFFALTLTDYGASRMTYANAVTTMGIQGLAYDHLIFGSYLDNIAGTPKRNLMITIPQFPNRGYLVTPKIESAQVEDIAQSLYIKYRPLKSIDSIIIKYKNKDEIGLPVSTAITSAWTSSTVLTTSADISEAMAYLTTPLNELELEVLSGAGAGQFPQITSITYSAPTYTITLAEAVEGVANGNIANFIINNWKLYKTITSADTENWMQAPIAKSSKFHKFKIILIGVDTTIEELQIVNKTQIPA